MSHLEQGSKSTKSLTHREKMIRKKGKAFSDTAEKKLEERINAIKAAISTKVLEASDIKAFTWAVNSLQGTEYLSKAKRSPEEMLKTAQQELSSNATFIDIFKKLLVRCIYQEQAKCKGRNAEKRADRGIGRTKMRKEATSEVGSDEE